MGSVRIACGGICWPCEVTLFYLAAPGAVGHLSFTEILDTSLKVSWSEPGEKNGVLTGTVPGGRAGDPTLLTISFSVRFPRLRGDAVFVVSS